MEKGLMDTKYKKNLTTKCYKTQEHLGRLILGLLVNTPNQIRLIGDKSLI